jgi:hypothetical protein
MIKKLMAVASLTIGVGAVSLIAPTVANARTPTAAEYAVSQCGNGGWEQKEYPSYDECYMFAIQYYFQQTGNGPGGGGGGSTGTWIPDLLPKFSPGHWGWGCGATHLPCNPGN